MRNVKEGDSWKGNSKDEHPEQGRGGGVLVKEIKRNTLITRGCKGNWSPSPIKPKTAGGSLQKQRGEKTRAETKLRPGPPIQL